VQVVYHTDFLYEPTAAHPYAPQYHWRSFRWIYPQRCPPCSDRYVTAHYPPPGIRI